MQHTAVNLALHVRFSISEAGAQPNKIALLNNHDASLGRTRMITRHAADHDDGEAVILDTAIDLLTCSAQAKSSRRAGHRLISAPANATAAANRKA